ncbi:MAG: hypothetical protein ACYC3X_30870 [Pirellulaceae bacterium]
MMKKQKSPKNATEVHDAVDAPMIADTLVAAEDEPHCVTDGLVGLQAVIVALVSLGLYSEYQETCNRIRVALEAERENRQMDGLTAWRKPGLPVSASPTQVAAEKGYFCHSRVDGCPVSVWEAVAEKEAGQQVAFHVPCSENALHASLDLIRASKETETRQLM